MVVTRKDAERIIRANVNLSAADKVRVGYKRVSLWCTGVFPNDVYTGWAAQKIDGERDSAVRLGRIFRDGGINWSI